MNKFYINLLYTLFTGVIILSGFVSSVDAACKDKRPLTAPVLISATADTNETVTLTWTEGLEPITHYLVAYGRTSTEIEYGNPNIGGKGTTSYTVGGLVSGEKYYFKVAPVNGCRPGKFSNKLSVTPGARQVSLRPTPPLSIFKPVLGASTSAQQEVNVENFSPQPAVSSEGEHVKCENCTHAWPLLLLSAVALIFYLFAGDRVEPLKQIYSIFIPIGFYSFFYIINRGCSLNSFECKYFIPLQVIIFIIVETAYKRLRLKNKQDEGNK